MMPGALDGLRVVDFGHYIAAPLAATMLSDQGADVIHFRPGVMDRLGLGPQQMTGGNQRLIYCAIPGFAADDPRAGLQTTNLPRAGEHPKNGESPLMNVR